MYRPPSLAAVAENPVFPVFAPGSQAGKHWDESHVGLEETKSLFKSQTGESTH